MNVSELLLIVIVIVVGILPLFLCRNLVHGFGWLLTLLAPTVFLIAALVRQPRQDPAALAKPQLPRQRVGDEFVSSKACRSCHPSNYESWHGTYHRTMTQLATPQTVMAPFNNLRLQSRGRTYRLERRGNRFWVQMADPDWEVDLALQGVNLDKVNDYPVLWKNVVMTTGWHHYQAYWVPGRDGLELRQLPFVYHLEERRWIPREDAFLQPPTEGRQFAVWNGSCIQCHSVGGEPNLDRLTESMLSRVVEFGIGCESCHGPGAAHVRHHRNPVTRYRQHLTADADTTIVNPLRCLPEIGSQICGQCHAFFDPRNLDDWWDEGYRNSYRPGGELKTSRHILRLEATHRQHDPNGTKLIGEIDGPDSLFWPDGTVRVGGREYNGLILSACYTQGTGNRKMSCLSCHSMHGYVDRDDQLKANGNSNRVCTACHTEDIYRERIQQHTHHPANSDGSRCYNCHMPHTTYALFKAIRSHRVDSPSVATSVRTGRPNACNLCHLDQTLKWTNRHLAEWYGTPVVDLSQDQRRIAASLLWLSRGDAAQRIILAWNMGWGPAHEASGKQWLAPFLAQLLDDPYSAVRFVAWRSLRTLPGFDGFTYDFVASKQERSDAVQTALEAWSHAEPDRVNQLRNPEQILLGPSGTFRREEFERLLRQRDDHAVSISE